MNNFDFVRFVVCFILGSISTVLFLEFSRRVRRTLEIRKTKKENYNKLIEEHAAARQALSLLKANIYVSHSPSKEHVISKHEKDFIDLALQGVYTVRGL